jgi:hypothetical protein
MAKPVTRPTKPLSNTAPQRRPQLGRPLVSCAIAARQKKIRTMRRCYSKGKGSHAGNASCDAIDTDSASPLEQRLLK